MDDLLGALFGSDPSQALTAPLTVTPEAFGDLGLTLPTLSFPDGSVGGGNQSASGFGGALDNTISQLGNTALQAAGALGNRAINDYAGTLANQIDAALAPTGGNRDRRGSIDRRASFDRRAGARGGLHHREGEVMDTQTGTTQVTDSSLSGQGGALGGAVVPTGDVSETGAGSSSLRC